MAGALASPARDVVPGPPARPGPEPARRGPEPARRGPEPARRGPERPPGLAAAWLLRTAGVLAVAAAAMGVVVAPGVRGNASERVVVLADRASASLAYFLVGVLAALTLWGTVELLRARAVGLLARIALVGSGAAVVALSAPGLRERLPEVLAVVLAAAAAVGAIAAATVAVRTPHTRALAALLLALAFAAIARLGAWELARSAGERASVTLYGYGRILATAGVLLEAAAQLAAVTWLGTRSKLAGQVGSSAALVAAFVLTWGVARGVHSDAAPWQSMMHTALADAPGLPPPYGLEALATFLVPASLLLALVAASQPNEVVAVVATVALVLVSRGSFDAPLRALCAVAAAQWAALAAVDERAMWRTLIEDRKRKLVDE